MVAVTEAVTVEAVTVEAVTVVVVTAEAVTAGTVAGTDPVATVVLIRVLGGVGVAVETAVIGAGMAGAILGRGTVP